MSSFSNVGFVPHDGENEEDAINLAPKSSESFPAEDSIFADGSPRHRTLFEWEII